MKLFSLLFSYFTISFNLYVFVKSYQALAKIKIKLNFFNYLVILISSIFMFLCNYYFQANGKILVSLFLLFCSYKIIFKEDFLLTLFKTIIIYLILLFCDSLVSIIFLFFPVKSFVDIGNITLLKDFCTILDSLLLMLVFLSRNIVNTINNLIRYVFSNSKILFFFVGTFALIVFIILTYLNATSFNVEMFFISVILMVFFLILCIILIFQYFKNKNKDEEQKALLSLMNEYEKVLDNERMNRHEMLNNLIILKSYNDKASLEYEETIDDIIKSYQDNKSDLYSKLYKLPSGIKGIIYYKMFRIKENNINLNLLSSPDIENNFKKLNSKLYFKVCKILGIVLDNAIEAASVTDNKILLIDIYYDDGLTIYIENSYNNTININDIHHKGVSSKGTNRGYGLYIVKKLLDGTDLLEFNQYLENDRFITVLKIKNPS